MHLDGLHGNLPDNRFFDEEEAKERNLIKYEVKIVDSTEVIFEGYHEEQVDSTLQNKSIDFQDVCLQPNDTPIGNYFFFNQLRIHYFLFIYILC